MAFGQCPCWYFLYLSDLKVINLIFQSKILVLGYFGLQKTTKLSLSDPLALFIIYAMYSTTLICFLGRQCYEYNAFPYGALLSRGLRDHKDLLSTSLPYQVPSLSPHLPENSQMNLLHSFGQKGKLSLIIWYLKAENKYCLVDTSILFSVMLLTVS